MRQQIKIFCLLAFWGFLLYAVNLQARFVFDDHKAILGNPFITHPGHILELWNFDPTRFLPNLTMAWTFEVSPKTTIPFHAVNVVLHILSAGLVYLLVDSFLAPRWAVFRNPTASCFFSPAAFAALIFLSHPIQTAAVSYLSQRGTVMVALFYLAAFYCYLMARRHKKITWYAAALGLAFAGAVTKPTIVTLPLVLVLAEFFFLKDEKEKPYRRILAVAPFFALWILLPQLLVLLERSLSNPYAIVDLTRQTNTLSRADYFFTQLAVLIKYIQLLFVPVGQNLDYDFPVFHGLFVPPAILSFAALGLLIYLALIWRSRQPWLSFAAAWFFVTLLPESSFIPIEDVIFEHRLYLVMFGFGLLVTVFLFWIPSARLRNFSAVAVILIFSGLTMSRNYIWADAERLYKDTMTKSPQKLRPLYNLASLYLSQGKIDPAQEVLKTAMHIYPNEPMNYYNMGRIYEQRKDFDKAINFYSQGTRSGRALIAAESWWRLGNLHALKGDNERAELYYQASLEINPKSDLVRCDLANLYSTTGRFKEAIAEYEKAIAINPLSLNSRNGLAAACIVSGDQKKGFAEYMELLRLYPETKIVLMNVGKIYFLRKDFLSAEPFFKKVSTIDPEDAEAYFYLSKVYNSLGDPQQAVQSLRRAIDLLKAQGQNKEAAQLESYLKTSALPTGDRVPVNVTAPDAKTPSPASPSK